MQKNGNCFPIRLVQCPSPATCETSLLLRKRATWPSWHRMQPQRTWHRQIRLQRSRAWCALQHTPARDRVAPAAAFAVLFAYALGLVCGMAALTQPRWRQEEDYNLFLDLVGKMLTYDPTERILPEDALRHQFLQRESLHIELAQPVAAMDSAVREHRHPPPPPPSEAWAPAAPTELAPQHVMQADDGSGTATMELVEDPSSLPAAQPLLSNSGDGGSHDAALSARAARAAKLQQRQQQGSSTSD